MSGQCVCGCGRKLEVEPTQIGVRLTLHDRSICVSDEDVPGLIADLLTASRRVDS